MTIASGLLYYPGVYSFLVGDTGDATHIPLLKPSAARHVGDPWQPRRHLEHDVHFAWRLFTESGVYHEEERA